jgi:hypothetical protein
LIETTGSIAAPPEIPRVFLIVEPNVTYTLQQKSRRERAMSFFVGLLLFVVVVGILDAKLPWPRPRESEKRP